MIVLNGNGNNISELITVSDIKPNYLNTAIFNQYSYLFDAIELKYKNTIDDYLVICPFYQNHIARFGVKPLNNQWLIPSDFDYQPAVTGKAKALSTLETDEYGIVTMRRELIEELNLSLNPKSVKPNYIKFPKYNFGVVELTEISQIDINPVWKYEQNLMDDFNKKIMVVVLERKDNMHLSHINDNRDCEHDIVGTVRIPLRTILNDIMTKRLENRKRSICLT